MKTKLLFFFLILFISEQVFSQVDTLIYYDVRTGIIEEIPNVFIDSSKSFDFTEWNYGSERGFSELKLDKPPNTFHGSGFTDYTPVHLFYSTSSYPIRTAVKLFIYYDDSLAQGCSGIMVSNDLVLTASHCVCRQDFMDSILVMPAFDNGEENPIFGKSISEGYYIPKSNLDYFIRDDIALIKLREPIGIKTGWIGIAFSDNDNFFENKVFHKLSYPATVDLLDSTRVYNGDTLYYNYGTLDYVYEKSFGFNIFGIKGQSGSSLFYTNNTVFYSFGTLSTAFGSNHYRIRKDVFYAFKNIINKNITYVDNRKDMKDYYLSNAYPNPFNPISKISYYLPHNSYISLIVYNILGKVVAVLENGYKNKGEYEVEFDGKNLPSGVYIFTMNTNNFFQSKKMLLLK